MTTHRPRSHNWTLVSAAVIALAIGAARPACAQLNQVNVFNNEVYEQTSSSAPTTPAGYFFNIGALFNNPGDFTAATATFPGTGSPQALTLSGTSFGFGSPFGSLSAIHAAYGFGTYNYAASGGTQGPATAKLSYTADNFTSAIPALSAATYTTLNGYNPANAISAVFNAFTPNGNANEAFTFFTIFDAATSAVVYSAGFLDPSTTSALIPANTLAPDTAYTYELDFSDRLQGLDEASGVTTFVGSDVRTDGAFTTGPPIILVPEPASVAVLAIALAGLGVSRRRRRG